MRTGYQTALKVISIILIVISVFGIVGGIMLIMGGSIVGFAGSNPDVAVEISEGVESTGVNLTAGQATMAVTLVAVAAGVVMIIASALVLITGILGVRGSNDPSKIMPFRVFCIIGLVFSAISLFTTLTDGSGSPNIWGPIVDVVLLAVCVWLSVKVREQGPKPLHSARHSA